MPKAETVALKHSLPLRKSKCLPYRELYPKSDYFLSETQQCFLCFVQFLTCCHPAWAPPCFVLVPGTVLCPLSLFSKLSPPLPIPLLPHSPHSCLLPFLSLVTNNAHFWWKAQLCGNPWQRNVSSCQARVMPGSVAWSLSVVSAGPGLKVFVSASLTPIRAGLHLWSFAGPWP